MQEDARARNGIENLVESLEKITARLLETTVANNQIATSHTPEIRELFDKWLEYLTKEITALAEGDVDLDALSGSLGLSTSSTLSLLLALERRGEIKIPSLHISRGDGKNREICDCLRSS